MELHQRTACRDFEWRSGFTIPSTRASACRIRVSTFATSGCGHSMHTPWCVMRLARRIVTLYEDNQRLQLALGARPERLSIIPNGIDIARFENVASLNARGEPTVALIGRVVPIKDVKSYIEAVALIRKKISRAPRPDPWTHRRGSGVLSGMPRSGA